MKKKVELGRRVIPPNGCYNKLLIHVCYILPTCFIKINQHVGKCNIHGDAMGSRMDNGMLFAWQKIVGMTKSRQLPIHLKGVDSVHMGATEKKNGYFP